MGFIGVQPATVPLTANDITDGIISTAKIADDAVDNTKLDLTANYAFTGTVTGASSGLVKLLSATWSSAVAEYDITNSIITSTFDDYLITWRIQPSTDSTELRLRFSTDGGSTFDSGSNYGYELQNHANNVTSTNNGGTYIPLSYTNLGNASGEISNGYLYLHDANSTTFPTTILGQATGYNNGANHNGFIFSGGQIYSARTNNVDGLRFATASGNLEIGRITVYGITK